MKTKEKNTSTNDNATNNNVHVLGPWEETGIRSKKKKHVDKRRTCQLNTTTFSPPNCSRGGKNERQIFGDLRVENQAKDTLSLSVDRQFS